MAFYEGFYEFLSITGELGDYEVKNFNKHGFRLVFSCPLDPGSNINSAFVCCLYLEISLCISEPQVSYLQSGGNPNFHDVLL